ncbi:MAG: hypothetical protein HY423_12195 [Candidatus Lambdaproteobacteria bacterium]|nr:hypothetical protein [Candidatus Lambdaproteobacteria bacterium]
MSRRVLDLPVLRRTAGGMVALALAAIVVPPPALAQSTSSSSTQFQLAPPPLAYPDYTEPRSTQSRFTGTAVTVSGNDLDMTGFGASYNSRTVLEPLPEGAGHGVGLGVGGFSLSGTAGTADIVALNMTLQGNYERELLKTAEANMIGFVGLNMGFGYANISASSFEADSTTLLLGYQVGAQLTFKGGDWWFSPFATYSYSSGSTDTTTYLYVPPYYTTSSSTSFDLSVTTFGFDILHAASGVTLSSMLQDNRGDSSTTVMIFQVSYAWGGSGRAEKPQGQEPPKASRQRGLMPVALR